MPNFKHHTSLLLLLVPFLFVNPLSLRPHPSVITPVGPFSSCRSKACEFGGSLDSRMSSATSGITGDDNFMLELQRLTVEFQINETPPPTDKVAKIVDKMERSHEQYNDLLTRLSLSKDFQSLEYYSLTVTQLEKKGMTLDLMNECVQWQINSMKAYSTNSLPPQPPPSVLKMIQQNQNQPPPMMGVPSVTSPPFSGNEGAFDDPVLKLKLRELVNDHQNLIDLGSGYGGFDASGKIAYIDEIEKVEDRWGVFMMRLDLDDVVEKGFKEETRGFLEGMGMGVDGFYEGLEEAHNWMRMRAEESR
ncbi:hypothetical protein TrST_g1570 [Triparma strigata]|uniref:Uncharacterized protein n=1 Tax=Triparma strigata TaxID=1606541 RepID=A0A9W7BVW2_9STRA|nr:hypothetical protein TrST_g1570 [Triparma strigata]